MDAIPITTPLGISELIQGIEYGLLMLSAIVLFTWEYRYFRFWSEIYIALLARLEQALPGAVIVKRAKRGLRGPKLVTEIAVDSGGERLELKRVGDDVTAVRAKSSGGIVLKTETIDIDTWLSALTTAVAAQAERSERTRQALQQLVLDR